MLQKDIRAKIEGYYETKRTGDVGGAVEWCQIKLKTSMVPRGHVVHHQQTCSAQQRVVPTITQLSLSGILFLRRYIKFLLSFFSLAFYIHVIYSGGL